MIHGPPQEVRLTVDLHENLVEMPTPVRIAARPARPFPTDFSGEHRAKSVLPETNRFVADVNSALVEQIFRVPER